MTIPLPPLFRKIVFWLFAAFTTFLSLMPAKQVEVTFSAKTQSFDFEAHSALYFIFTTLALLAYAERKPSRVNVVLSVAIFGGIMEILQATLPWVNRSCQVGDFKANTLGAIAAALLFPLLMWVAKKAGFKIAALCAALFCVSLAAGCATDTHVPTSNSVPRKIIGLETERQSNEGYCAPAVLASLLRYHGIAATQEQLAAEAGSTENDGTDIARLLDAVAANHLSGTWRITPVFEATFRRGARMINRYNALADEAGVARIHLPGSGRLVDDEAVAGAGFGILPNSASAAA
ncbi:MAG: VanZ family protein, partial [Kiritimatiellaeota bacterium]|nr:VanZ family protein [Kiritimatiellota bacterium]